MIFQAHIQTMFEWLRRGGADPHIATSHWRPYKTEGDSSGLGSFVLSTAFPSTLAIDNDALVWGTASGRDLTNIVELDFGTAAVTETVNGLVELDGSGNPRNWCRFTTAAALIAGDPLKIPAGNVDHGMRDTEFSFQAIKLLEHERGVSTYTVTADSSYFVITTVGDASARSTFGFSVLFPTALVKNNDNTVWDSPSGSSIKNLVDFDFGSAGPGTTEVIVGILEDDGSGNPHVWFLLDAPRYINPGDPLLIAAGKLTDQYVQEFS